MKHPETYAITKNHGPRPAGRDDECFYCHGPLGADHHPNCVMRDRTVVVRATVEYVVRVPERHTPDQIEFRRNESSWCASNMLSELDSPETCICNAVTFEYVREATEEDERTIYYQGSRRDD